MVNEPEFFLETRHIVAVLMYAYEHDGFINSNIRAIVPNAKNRAELLNYLVCCGLMTDTRDNKRLRTIHYTLSKRGKEVISHITQIEDIVRAGSASVDSVSSDTDDRGKN